MKRSADCLKRRLKRVRTYLKKGSYTAEAAVIVGMAVLVLMTVLDLCSFLYGRSVLTASAYEQAFSGRHHVVETLFGVEEIQSEVSFGEKANEVTYSGICTFVWSGHTKELMVRAHVQKKDPVTFLWRLQEANELIK